MHDRFIPGHQLDMDSPVDVLIAGEHELATLQQRREGGGHELERDRASGARVPARAKRQVLERRWPRCPPPAWPKQCRIHEHGRISVREERAQYDLAACGQSVPAKLDVPRRDPRHHAVRRQQAQRLRNDVGQQRFIPATYLRPKLRQLRKHEKRPRECHRDRLGRRDEQDVGVGDNRVIVQSTASESTDDTIRSRRSRPAQLAVELDRERLQLVAASAAGRGCLAPGKEMGIEQRDQTLPSRMVGAEQESRPELAC